MKHNRKPLATAIHSALGAGVVAGLAMTAAPVLAQDQGEEMTEDRIVVTGSRIVRDDLDGAVPVQIIDRASIEFSGKTSVADLLRNQPINSGGSFRPQSGSTAQSFGGVSLRALGEGRTLVLIDGRRAPTAPNVGSGQDLNAIPLAAVERIEILSDGASAIYGSDAIGGVVNIITRQDFTGAELMIGASDPKRKGGETREASAIMGVSGADGRILAGVSNNKRDIIFQRDREWSRGGNSIFSNNFLTSGFGFLDHPEFGSANVPGCQGEGFVVSGERCFYDFTLQAADEAEIENQSIFLRGSYDINPDWSLHLNSGVTRVKSFGRYAPVPSSPWLVGGFGAIVLDSGLPNHPATPPDQGGLNPNWQDYQEYADDTLLLTHRFAANGPRDTNTDASVYDLDIFMTGRVGEYDVEFGARRVESQYYELGRNYVVSALAQPQFDSGAYNIYDPFGNPQDVLQSFTATINRDARFVSREYRGLITGDLFEMANGPAGFAFGAEYRDEDYKDIFDDLQANGNITGSSGNSAFGDRDQWAVYGELLFPVLEDLEVSLAGRYDDYSDFGTNFSPKVSLRWDPLDTVGFRASYGEGFRAPPLDLLSLQPSFSADSVVHAPTAENFGNEDLTEAIQVNGFVIANPDLGAEQSEQFSFGAVFEPTNWLTATLDYWSIEITDRVAGIGAQQIINCLEGTTTNCPPGLASFPAGSSGPDADLGLGAQFGENGQITFLQRGFASLGTIETDGIDASVRTNWDFGEFGTLTSEINASYLMTQEIDNGSNVAGEAGLPEWRAVWANSHAWGDFNFAWNINYIGPQDSAESPNLDSLPSWVTHDVQASYFTPWNGRITLGVDNLVDKDPVLDPGQGRGFDFELYNGYGRITYLRYTQNF
ncbi:TonB-dependent receptor [Wenzhouxiangella limi]|uniref:TonB-dependent receptor n=1 Tax=Wenzhouxiangella limi TaxID=2707351 RepID=A0A845UZ58_9GAMM|nr:TonB-dependent receptor [Wenzhouxiangella limi]NDY95572.1 TonB-dependent receptor [Wenzhouxiangella limi]